MNLTALLSAFTAFFKNKIKRVVMAQTVNFHVAAAAVATHPSADRNGKNNDDDNILPLCWDLILHCVDQVTDKQTLLNLRLVCREMHRHLRVLRWRDNYNKIRSVVFEKKLILFYTNSMLRASVKLNWGGFYYTEYAPTGRAPSVTIQTRGSSIRKQRRCDNYTVFARYDAVTGAQTQRHVSHCRIV